MTNSAVVLLVVAAAGLGALIALATERDEPRPSRESPRIDPEPLPPAPPAPDIAREASGAEAKLWSDRGCLTCHGGDGRGTEMGPDVIQVLPLYLAKYPTRVAALQPLAAYIFEPKTSPKLRPGEEGEYRAEMPGIAQLPGGTREEAVALAGLLLRLAR